MTLTMSQPRKEKNQRILLRGLSHWKNYEKTQNNGFKRPRTGYSSQTSANTFEANYLLEALSPADGKIALCSQNQGGNKRW